MSDERRQQIVDAARQLYEEQGLSATTVKDISERCGVARSLFYHYFRNKQEVTSAVIDDFVNDYIESLQFWNEQRTPGDIEGSLAGVVTVMRVGVFEHSSFRRALDTHENASLYLEFINRVADRMAASPGTKNYGAYTVKLRLYAEPAGRFAVGPGNFFPPPRVESAVLRLNRRPVFDDQGVPLDADAITAACTMAEAAFATRRKTLSNSCKTYFAGRGPQGAAVIARLPQLFERAGIDPRLRGETLDLPEFVRLGCAFQQIA